MSDILIQGSYGPRGNAWAELNFGNPFNNGYNIPGEEVYMQVIALDLSESNKYRLRKMVDVINGIIEETKRIQRGKRVMFVILGFGWEVTVLRPATWAPDMKPLDYEREIMPIDLGCTCLHQAVHAFYKAGFAMEEAADEAGYVLYPAIAQWLTDGHHFDQGEHFGRDHFMTQADLVSEVHNMMTDGNLQHLMFGIGLDLMAKSALNSLCDALNVPESQRKLDCKDGDIPEMARMGLNLFEEVSQRLMLEDLRDE